MKPANNIKFSKGFIKAGLFILPAVWILATFLNGCKTMESVTNIGTAIGVATGTIDKSQA